MTIGATRVQELTDNPGTGDATLEGENFGYQTFNDEGLDGIEVFYQLDDLDYVAETGDWEVGKGTYTHSTTSFERTTVLASSNAGSLVNFTGNNIRVSVGLPYDDFLDPANDLSELTDATAQSNLGLGDIATMDDGDPDADMVDDLHQSDLMQLADAGADIFAGEKDFTGATEIGVDVDNDELDARGLVNANGDTDSVFIIPVGVDLWGEYEPPFSPPTSGLTIGWWYDVNNAAFRSIVDTTRVQYLYNIDDTYGHDLSAFGGYMPYIQYAYQNGLDAARFYPGTGPEDVGYNRLNAAYALYTTDTSFVTWMACLLIASGSNGAIIDSQWIGTRTAYYNTAYPTGYWRRFNNGGSTDTTTPYIIGEPMVLCFVDDGTTFRAISESATGYYDDSNTGASGQCDGITMGRWQPASGPTDFVLFEAFRAKGGGIAEDKIQGGLTYLHNKWNIP